jgi:hypothetical protein
MIDLSEIDRLALQYVIGLRFEWRESKVDVVIEFEGVTARKTFDTFTEALASFQALLKKREEADRD